MLSAAIIVFREVLEAALIISIIMAATRGVRNRGWWVLGGIGGGLAGAVAVAFSADLISSAFEGMGQETFNASVLLAAVLMLAWHNIWMAQHGREMSKAAGTMALNVRNGEEPLYALTIAISMAVLREGSEVVLFLNGIASGGTEGGSLVMGSLAGILSGTVAGYCLYRGLVKIPVKQFFAVTAWLILLLAAGLAASAAGFLEQAGWLPALGYNIWNTSHILSQQSIAGQVLHTLVGYQDSPSGIQVLFYCITLVVIYTLMWLVGKREMRNHTHQATAC